MLWSQLLTDKETFNATFLIVSWEKTLFPRIFLELFCPGQRQKFLLCQKWKHEILGCRNKCIPGVRHCRDSCSSLYSQIHDGIIFTDLATKRRRRESASSMNFWLFIGGGLKDLEKQPRRTRVTRGTDTLLYLIFLSWNLCAHFLRSPTINRPFMLEESIFGCQQPNIVQQNFAFFLRIFHFFLTSCRFLLYIIQVECMTLMIINQWWTRKYYCTPPMHLRTRRNIALKRA